MIAVVQRAHRGAITVDGRLVAEVQHGLAAFVAIVKGDQPADADQLAAKLAALRVFPDEEGKMNRNVSEAGGSVLLVPNFTVAGDCRKGRRPSYDRAAAPEQAGTLFAHLVHSLRHIVPRVEAGEFGAHMEVEVCNDGPVTLLLDTRPGAG